MRVVYILRPDTPEKFNEIAELIQKDGDLITNSYMPIEDKQTYLLEAIKQINSSDCIYISGGSNEFCIVEREIAAFLGIEEC